MSPKDVRGNSSPAPGHVPGGSSRPLMRKRFSHGKLKPKRTSFPCVACGKTFLTQQALAGHSSIHSRGKRLNGDEPPVPAGVVAVDPVLESLTLGHQRHGLEIAGRHEPAVVVVPRFSYLPFVHRDHHMVTHQLPRVPPPCVQLLGPDTPPPPVADGTVLHAAAAFRRTAAVHRVQATALGLGRLLAPYVLRPLPRYATASGVPVRSHASMMSQQPGRVDLTFRLGYGGGNGGAGTQRRRMFAPLDGDDGGGDGAVPVVSCPATKDLDGFDLELRLGR